MIESTGWVLPVHLGGTSTEMRFVSVPAPSCDDCPIVGHLIAMPKQVTGGIVKIMDARGFAIALNASAFLSGDVQADVHPQYMI
jgi:hypothetical protein